jgi:predicted methyltransferase/aminoglycoside phosphotransferase (APT) family kinase protein
MSSDPRERIQAQILECLLRTGRAPWGVVADAQDGTLTEFHAAATSLGAEGLVTIEEGFIAPTAAGLAAAKRGGHPLDPRCSACDGRGYAVGARSGELAALERLLEGRPPPRLDLDQGAITAEDCWLRAAFLRERGDLHGTHVLMVGDFDMMSLALALVGGPERIVVLDLDERVVDFLVAVARRERLPIEARTYDVRRPLDGDLAGAFDLFHCDPVETLSGIRLYLSRGCAALRGLGARICFGLTAIEASRATWYETQRLVFDMGFVITDVRRRFSGYPDHDRGPEDSAYSYPVIDAHGAGSVDHCWHRSALIRAEAVRPPRPSVAGPVELDAALYVDDEAWATPRPAIEAPASRFLAEGYDFRVYERGDGTLVRMPKSPAAAAQMSGEVACLAALRDVLAVPIPDARLEIVDGTPAIVYQRLCGEPADAAALGAPGLTRLAADVGRFLSGLHALSLATLAGFDPPFRATTFHLIERLEEVRGAIRAATRRLPPRLAERCRRFLDGDTALPCDAPGPPVLLHGDFEAEHLLVDPATGALTGVLDWSELGLGDAARDIGGVWAFFGDEFLRVLLAHYDRSPDATLGARARFFGRCHALLAYDESLHGEILVTPGAALAQLERVFAGEPR